MEGTFAMRRTGPPRAIVSVIAILAWAGLARAQPAPNAQPSGGSVVAGRAAISQTATKTTIQQATQRAAINWQSFDIGSQQTVQFQQPSAAAVALNRVVGPNPSQIAGRIDANGQVVITNQSGVTFYRGAQVNTAGLMVTAAGISNGNFMAGRMVFDQAPNPNAAVVNQGRITVRDAGLAALVAPQVANSGVITARLGHVVLAGAQTATLDLYGDGLVAIDVTGQVVQAPNGATALVTNTGLVRADGGTVQLSARAVDGVVQTLVSAGGRIQADSVGSRTGTLVLNGVGGNITVAGQLVATGAAPRTTGGRIAVNGSGTVTVAAAAHIDASGQAGGGIVAIGTTLARAALRPGTPSRRTAANVVVAPGATIAANATAQGNGGRVTLLSQQTTVMDGAISATGGPAGGNGGFIETSGPTLSVGSAAVVDAGAPGPAGKDGTWLLDPLDLDVIGSGANENVSDPFVSPFTVTPTGAPSQILNAVIDRELGSGTDVILTTQGTTGGALGNITVDAGAPIAWASSATLTMNAAGNIIIDAPITSTGTPSNGLPNNSTLFLDALGGGITQDPANGAIIVGNLAISSLGPVSLTAANAVGTLAASVTGAGNGFAFRNDSAALTIGGIAVTGGPTINGITSAGGPILLATTTAGDIAVEAPIASNGGAISIATAPGGSFANDAAISSIGAGGDGNIVLLGDTLALATETGAVDAGTATVVLGPATSGLNIVLGAASSAQSLGLQTNDFGTITAGMVQVGYRALDGTASFTGDISIGGTAGIALTTANFPALLLVTGGAGTVSQSEPISFPGGTVGVIADANVTLPSGNSVATVAAFTDGGLLGFDNSVPLTVGSLALPTLGVALDASGFAGTSVLPGGTGLPSDPLSGVTTSAALTIGDTGGLTLAAGLTAPGQTVTLGVNGGGITQTAGIITAGTLDGGAATSIALNDSNAIATVTGFAALDGLSLADGIDLTVTGAVSGETRTAITTTGTLTVSGSVADTSGGTVSLIGGSIAITGTGLVSDGGTGTTGLTATSGTITENGTLLAGTLNGSAPGAATLTGASPFNNQIATLGNFSAGSLTLTDGTALTIAGPVTADYLNITATGRMVVAGNIATIGAPLAQQSGTTPAAQGSTLQVVPSPTSPGAAAQFVQTGTVTLTDPPATTLRVQLPATGGSASFADLIGTGANLVLALGTGTASGTMQVGGLLVIGKGGGATLAGSVAGVTTGAAAALGQITPAINPNYTFNGCTIGLAACGAPPILPTTPALPVTPSPATPASPVAILPTPPALAATPDTAVLGELTFFLPGPRLLPVFLPPAVEITLLTTPLVLGNQLAPQDVVPPNISFEDY